MRVIVAGSREISNYAIVQKAIEESGFSVAEIVSGAARGVDRLGEEWAAKNSIAVKKFPADWRTHGQSAGYLRNIVMAQYADALVAIWDGQSKGTAHMINIAEKTGLKVFIATPNNLTPSEHRDKVFETLENERIVKMSEKRPCPTCGKEVTWTAANEPRKHKCEPATQEESAPIQPVSSADLPVELVIKKFIETRERLEREKKEFEESQRVDKEFQEKRKAWLLGKLTTLGGDSITKKGIGTVFVDWKDSATVADPILFQNWISEDFEGRKHYLENRVSKLAVKDDIEEKRDLPPGVNYTRFKDVKVRRA